jgi:hypothetical protein
MRDFYVRKWRYIGRSKTSLLYLRRVLAWLINYAVPCLCIDEQGKRNLGYKETSLPQVSNIHFHFHFHSSFRQPATGTETPTICTTMANAQNNNHIEVDPTMVF